MVRMNGGASPGQDLEGTLAMCSSNGHMSKQYKGVNRSIKAGLSVSSV